MYGTCKKAGIAIAIAAIALSSAVGQSAKPDDPAKVRAAVAAVFDTYVRAVGSLDVDLWLSTWDEGGQKFTANAPAIVGKAAIANFVRPRFALFASRKMEIAIDSVDAFGDLALARGTYKSEDRLKSGGDAKVAAGWFLTVFKKQADGSWKIFRDCVASQVPQK